MQQLIHTGTSVALELNKFVPYLILAVAAYLLCLFVSNSAKAFTVENVGIRDRAVFCLLIALCLINFFVLKDLNGRNQDAFDALENETSETFEEERNTRFLLYTADVVVFGLCLYYRSRCAEPNSNTLLIPTWLTVFLIFAAIGTIMVFAGETSIDDVESPALAANLLTAIGFLSIIPLFVYLMYCTVQSGSGFVPLGLFGVSILLNVIPSIIVLVERNKDEDGEVQPMEDRPNQIKNFWIPLLFNIADIVGKVVIPLTLVHVSLKGNTTDWIKGNISNIKLPSITLPPVVPSSSSLYLPRPRAYRPPVLQPNCNPASQQVAPGNAPANAAPCSNALTSVAVGQPSSSFDMRYAPSS